MAEDTNASAKGFSTSEGKLTMIALVVGVVLEGASFVLHQLSAAGVYDENKKWAVVTFAVIGFVLQVATLLGYNKGRALVKIAMIQADSAALTAGKTQSTPPPSP